MTSRTKLTLLGVIAGVLVGLMTPPRRLADASNYVLMADSLVRDWDLVYERGDLQRARQMHFADLPTGLFLIKRGGTYAYAKPLVYPLLAVPAFAAFGVRGFLALNGLLLAAVILLGADILARHLPWKHALAAAAVLTGFSATPVYVHWIDPFLLCTALTAGIVVAYRRNRPGWVAALVVFAGVCRVPYLVLGAAPAALYTLQRRWRDLGWLIAVGVVTAAALLALNRFATGEWSPYLGERYYYINAFPYDGPGNEEVGFQAAADRALAAWRWPTPGQLLRSNVYYFFGRFSGVVLYFPTLLVCLLWCQRWDREKGLWLLALLGCCLAFQLVFPHNSAGGSHAVGNRFFALLPLGFALVDSVAWRGWRALATCALLLSAVPLIQAPVYFSVNAGRQMLEFPYRLFPLEWTQVRRISFPFDFPGMAALTENQYQWEPPLGGVWTVGGTKAAFVLIRPAGQPAVVRLWSLLPAARLTDGGVPIDMQFQPWVEQELQLKHPVVAFADESNDFRKSAAYLLTVETTSCARAADYGASNDPRCLGVFVRPMP